MVLGTSTTAFASDKIEEDADYDSERDFASEAAKLNSEKQYFEEKYLEMMDLEKGEVDFRITYDQEVTAEILKLSETTAVKIQTVEIEETPIKPTTSKSGTQSWDKSGTYLCNG